MRILGGYQDTRTNKEDFALTPYLFGVFINENIKVIGFGICWGWASAYLGIGFGVPKSYKSFKVLKVKENE